MLLGTLPWEGINVILAEPWLVLYRGLLQTSRTDVTYSLVLPGLSYDLSLLPMLSPLKIRHDVTWLS